MDGEFSFQLCVFLAGATRTPDGDGSGGGEDYDDQSELGTR